MPKPARLEFTRPGDLVAVRVAFSQPDGSERFLGFRHARVLPWSSAVPHMKADDHDGVAWYVDRASGRPIGLVAVRWVELLNAKPFPLPDTLTVSKEPGDDREIVTLDSLREPAFVAKAMFGDVA